MMAWTEGTAKLKVRFRQCKSKRDFNLILLGVVVLLVLGKVLVKVLSPVRDHCVVFCGKTLYSHSVLIHPGVYKMRKGGRERRIHLRSLSISWRGDYIDC